MLSQVDPFSYAPQLARRIKQSKREHICYLSARPAITRHLGYVCLTTLLKPINHRIIPVPSGRPSTVS